MKKILCTASAIALMSGASFAQGAPSGAEATGCAPDRFAPVLSDRTGEILYWNNPTCPAGSGPSGTVMMINPPNGGEPPIVDEPYDDGGGGCTGSECYVF